VITDALSTGLISNNVTDSKMPSIEEEEHEEKRLFELE
jgi:hypothetical protein